MTEEDNKAIKDAIQNAKELKRGGVYLFLFNHNSLSRSLVDALRNGAEREGIKLIVVGVHGNPDSNVQLYRIFPEESL